MAPPQQQKATTTTIAQTDGGLQTITERLRATGVQVQFNDKTRIGRGTHSEVFRATTSKGMVAIKLIDMKAGGDYIRRFLERELRILKQLKHPRVVNVFAIERTPQFVAIVEEYAPGGDLLNYIRTRPNHHLDEDEARPLFRQLMQAIVYLEGLKIVHRDIKCENIFMMDPKNIKLGDFGFARTIRPGEDSTTHCGSKPYAATELLTGLAYRGNAVDIWSTGVVLYVILTGYFPFGGAKDDIEKIIQRQRLHKISFPSRLSKAVRDLILHMLQPKPENRFTSGKILGHEWYTHGRLIDDNNRPGRNEPDAH